MEFYTLDENFQKYGNVIDNFSSAIWTERYSKAGDGQLVVPPSDEMISRLVEGSFLQTNGSKEVMLIDTALIEDGKLKVTGNFLTKFLNERFIRNGAYEDQYVNMTGKPGTIMASNIVHTLVILDTLSGDFLDVADGSLHQTIPNLIRGAYDIPGDAVVTIAVPYGPMYDALEQIAETYSLGFSMYLETTTPSPPALFTLVFTVYKGLDRTSGQMTNSVVRFSQSVDSLRDLTELRSIEGYKNVAYAVAPNKPGDMTEVGVAFADGANESTPTGFDRRIMVVTADDITTDRVGGSAATLKQMLDERARDALANNNYTKVIDGEIVPQSKYKYGTHFKLGDIVELESKSGIRQNARITEYIRTEDATGERAYPTVSVID